jgi:hypothetical protein
MDVHLTKERPMAQSQYGDLLKEENRRMNSLFKKFENAESEREKKRLLSEAIYTGKVKLKTRAISLTY